MKHFDTPVYTMLIHDDLLIEFKVKRDMKLHEKDIWESREQSVNAYPGKKFLVLLEGEDNIDVSADARRAGASEEYSKHVAAVAMYSAKVHESIMGNLFLRVNKPRVPTKFFDNRDKALAWLREFRPL